MNKAPTGPNATRATATIPEFARRYGVARSTAYALAHQDALPVPVIRLGRRLVVSRDLMERVLAGEPTNDATSRRTSSGSRLEQRREQ